MPHVMPPEILKAGVLDRGVEPVLQVVEGSGWLLALPVDECIDLVLLRVPEAPEGCVRRAAERDRVRLAVLGPRVRG